MALNRLPLWGNVYYLLSILQTGYASGVNNFHDLPPILQTGYVTGVNDFH